MMTGYSKFILNTIYIELGLVSSDSISHEKAKEIIELKDILKPRVDA